MQVHGVPEHNAWQTQRLGAKTTAFCLLGIFIHATFAGLKFWFVLETIRSTFAWCFCCWSSHGVIATKIWIATLRAYFSWGCVVRDSILWLLIVKNSCSVFCVCRYVHYRDRWGPPTYMSSCPSMLTFAASFSIVETAILKGNRPGTWFLCDDVCLTLCRWQIVQDVSPSSRSRSNISRADHDWMFAFPIKKNGRCRLFWTIFFSWQRAKPRTT